MSSFGVYLDSVSLPIVQKVLVGLGFGTITYVGLQAGFDALQSLVVTNMGAVSASMGALFYMAGFNTSIGIVLSAGSMRLAMVAIKKFGVL
jgi:hypothetical protein